MAERDEVKNVKYYDPANTDTSSTVVTINEDSGLAIFNTVITAGSTVPLTIISDRWRVNEELKLMLELEYGFQESGEPAILNYGYDGIYNLVIMVKNHGMANTTDVIKIKFSRG